MASNIPTPQMDWHSHNLLESWKKFRQHAELMFSGPLKKTSGEEKSAYLLIWIGEKGRDIFNTWTLTTEQSRTLDELYNRFEAHVTPKSNAVFARYKFQKRNQGTTEPLDTFITDLQLLVKDCAYQNPSEMVRDRIICGLHSYKIQETLLQKGDDLTMEKAIEIAKAHEATKEQLRSMSASTEQSNIDAINSAQRGHKFSDRMKKQSKRQDGICGSCGGQPHRNRSDCPAYGKTCRNCQKQNHFHSMCRSTSRHTTANSKYSRPRQKMTKHKYKTTIHSLDTNESDSDSFYVDAINSEDKHEVAYVTIKVEGNDIKFKLDTGAQVNVLPLSIFRSTQMNKIHKVRKTTQKLVSYSGDRLNVIGSLALHTSYEKTNTHDENTEFFVVDTASPPIFGLRSCIDFGIIDIIMALSKESEQTEAKITWETITSEYKELFSGLGKFPHICKITLKEDAVPVQHPPRRIPHALHQTVKAELDNMEKLGVITKVTEPTDWVNSLVLVEKPGSNKIRICLDPKNLNLSIKRPQFYTPTLEEVTSQLSGAKYFTKLDAKSGYWQIELDKDSSYYTTFNSPFGRYRFLRMPFGITSAQDEFQRQMYDTLQGIPGQIVLIDDILVFGNDMTTHNKNLKAVLNRLKENNVHLNPEKLDCAVQEVNYFGHIITCEGIKPDATKVDAIKSIQAPKDKKELQTILGMITYLSKFTPQLAELTAPLRSLLKKDILFQWEDHHTRALEDIKNIISADTTLAYFDPNEDITIQVDASKHGIGVMLSQSNKPLAFASKSLTETEQRYAQIEKELLAVLFGAKRFHHYLYGRHFYVQSDHKPLESIVRKPLASAPPRLQRMLLQLQKYTFTLVHVPGKDIPVADALSRHCSHNTFQEYSSPADIEAQIHSVIRYMPVSDAKMKDIARSSKIDQQFQILKDVIRNGWPDKRQNCPPSIQAFWNSRDELSECEDIILKGEKIVIPEALRPQMLSKLHASHQGIEKTKRRAREVMYWPNISSQIEDMIKRCTTCISRSNSNKKEPLLPHDIPSRPWEKVACDIFTWDNKEYLVTVDYYSRFFEINALRQISSKFIIEKLSTHFARYGIPSIVVSDNGPQFSSQEFASFAESFDFQHITSSPKYPQSNGLGERSVQTAKNILEKAKLSGQNPYLNLLEYRNTPVDNLAAPAQLLMGRRLRSTLPSLEEHLQPQIIKPQLLQNKRHFLQQRQKQYYDKSTSPLCPIQPNDKVFLQTDNRKWIPATTIQTNNDTRSHTVQTQDGAIYRRNRRHLKLFPPTNQHDERESEREMPPNEFTSPDTTNSTQHDQTPSTNIIDYPNQIRASPNNHGHNTDHTFTRSGRRVKTPWKLRSP